MIEVRCPACLPLGYPIARLMFIVHGVMAAGEEPVLIQFNCKRCKSVVQWKYASVDFMIIKAGVKNNHRQNGVYE